jgi:NADH:ubiquinone oxidoreductase subunit F (NADH-binding)
MDAKLNGHEQDNKPNLRFADDVAWQMAEGSICGLGQIAALPLTSARRYFPEDFR